MTKVTVDQSTTYDLTNLYTTFTANTDIDVTTAGDYGVYGDASQSWVVLNLGDISGSAAFYFVGAATLVNEGKISDGTDIGTCVYIGGAGSVTNSGSIMSSGTGTGGSEGGSSAIFLQGGGAIFNEASGTIFGNVTLGASGTINNAGVISNSGQNFAVIDLLAGGKVKNSGTVDITSGAQASGIYLVDGGTASNTGKITGSATNMSAIYLENGGTAINKGVIDLSSTMHISALEAALGGNLVNFGQIDVTVSVSSASGMQLDDGGTVTNSGRIYVSSPGDSSGVYLANGGTLDNLSGGSIKAGRLNAVNAGGSTGVKIVNAGTLAGADSINLYNAGASDAPIVNKVKLETGSTLKGAVVGSTGGFVTNDLVFTGSGSASNAFLNFQHLTVNSGAVWSLLGSTGAAQTTVEGQLIVGASGSLLGPVTIEGGKAVFDEAYDSNVTFDGAGVLKLSDAYSDIISGLGAGDRIDLLGQTFQSGDKVDISGHVMSVETSANAVLTTLTLGQGTYANSDFTVGKDALGHILISHN